MLGELGAAFLGATPGSAAAGAALVAPDRETEVLLVAALSGFDAMSAAWTAQLPQVVQRSTRRSQELGEALLRIASSCAPDGIAGAMNAIIAAAPALAEVPELEDRLVGVVRAQRSFFVGDAIEVLAAIRGGPDAEEAELARLGDGRHARLVLRAFAELARRERLAGHGARELVQSVLAAGELPREFLGRREPLRVGCSLGVEVDAALALALSAQGQAVAIGARVEALADVFGLEPEEVPAWIAVRIREGRMAATFRRLEERARAELLVAPGIAPLRE
jgi:hypothetical protein